MRYLLLGGRHQVEIDCEAFFAAVVGVMEGAREAKVPKFKRCKISRQQLVVLMQHFGEFNRPKRPPPSLGAHNKKSPPLWTVRETHSLFAPSPRRRRPAPVL